MKKIFTLSALAIMMVLAFASCSDDEKNIEAGQLPSNAVSFIKAYFPDDTVTVAKQENDGKKAKYEVTLASGYEIEFDHAGEWTDIDAPDGMTVPEGIIPTPITNYVAEHHPNEGINEISKESYGYKVELTTKVDLHFNKDGVYIISGI